MHVYVVYLPDPLAYEDLLLDCHSDPHQSEHDHEADDDRLQCPDPVLQCDQLMFSPALTASISNLPDLTRHQPR